MTGTLEPRGKDGTAPRDETAASRPLSSWLFLSAYVATLLDALVRLDALVVLANLAVILFVALEYRKASGIARVVGAVLVAVGVVAAAIGSTGGVSAVAESLWEGIRQTQQFLVLFGAVAWLQVPAGESPSLRAIREMVLTQPPGRRFAFLGAAAHGLGVAFNIAGMSLLSGMVSHQEDRVLRRRLGRAMAQGFATATCWSPFFVGTAVILAMLPRVAWLEIAPFGVCLSLLLFLLSWGLDRITRRGGAAGGHPATPARVPARAWGRAAMVLGALFAGTLLLVETLGLSIPIALGMVAPPLAFLWRAGMADPAHRADHPAARGVAHRAAHRAARGMDLARRVVGGLATLRGETVLFLAANVMGAGIAASLDPQAVAAALATLGIGGDARIVLLALGFVLCGAIGLHPVILVILVGHMLPPEVLGIPPEAMALMLMALWGPSTNVSPVSATVLYLSRITGEGNLTVAWRWNAPFSVLAACLIAAFVVAGRHAGL